MSAASLYQRVQSLRVMMTERMAAALGVSATTATTAVMAAFFDRYDLASGNFRGLVDEAAAAEGLALWREYRRVASS